MCLVGNFLGVTPTSSFDSNDFWILFGGINRISSLSPKLSDVLASGGPDCRAFNPHHSWVFWEGPSQSRFQSTSF